MDLHLGPEHLETESSHLITLLHQSFLLRDSRKFFYFFVKKSVYQALLVISYTFSPPSVLESNPQEKSQITMAQSPETKKRLRREKEKRQKLIDSYEIQELPFKYVPYLKLKGHLDILFGINNYSIIVRDTSTAPGPRASVLTLPPVTHSGSRAGLDNLFLSLTCK